MTLLGTPGLGSPRRLRALGAARGLQPGVGSAAAVPGRAWPGAGQGFWIHSQSVGSLAGWTLITVWEWNPSLKQAPLATIGTEESSCSSVTLLCLVGAGWSCIHPDRGRGIRLSAIIPPWHPTSGL